MTFRTLIRRSLRFHWRSHLGVVLGAAIGSAALIGALVVGDSVKGSLRERALERLGRASLALSTVDRFFDANLSSRLPGRFAYHGKEEYFITEHPVTALVVAGTATSATGDARANHVNVVGVHSQTITNESAIVKSRLVFWKYSPSTHGPTLGEGETWVNEALAMRLGVRKGDSLLLRFAKPTTISAESPLSTKRDDSKSLRLTISGVVPAEEYGDFNLTPSSSPALNAFVHLPHLQQALELDRRANLILYADILGGQKGVRQTIWNIIPVKLIDYVPDWLIPDYEAISGSEMAAIAQKQLHTYFKFEDLQSDLNYLSTQGFFELRTERVFLDPPLARAVNTVSTTTNYVLDVFAQRVWGQTNPFPHYKPTSILTYLVNLLHCGTNYTPYSMVTAAGSPWTPADLRDNEIVVSQWLADDLQVKPGDEIALVYFDPESGARLVEHTNTFRVHSIVPMEMPWADPTLMPDFPGIEKAESTSEWDAGFPLTYKVREKDDDYWKQYRGTPKAFITLAAGQKMWGNRFGNLTAIRFPVPTNALPLTPALSPAAGERENRSQPPGEYKAAGVSNASGESKNSQQPSPLPLERGEGQGEGSSLESYRAALEKKILANLKPEELGLRFEPVREQALKAAEESQDFGGLFLGFSFFVIAAALLLMALLFSLGLEQRAPEIGTLLALGFTPKQVRKLLLREAVVLSLIGGVIGALGGLGYAKAMLHGLTTIWRDAVGASALSFHFTAQTLVIGIFASAVVSVVTIWLALRKFVKRPARELLVGEIGADESKVQSLKSKVVAVAALLAGVALAGWAVVSGETANAGIFFGAGALVLVAGLSFASARLAQLGGAPLSESARSSSNDRKHAGPQTGAPITVGSLAVRGCARRRKRSLATVAMLACGSFLIVSIGVFRLDANRDATKKTSGTGGFALIGETTMPVVHDLNAESGRDFFALNERDLEGVNFVPFRVREGDEASCLNLNRAQKPRLLGVKSEMLEGRFGFTKGEGWAALRENRGWKMEDGKGDKRSDTTDPSSILHPPSSLPEIPAIGDANSIQWAMGKKVGDTLDYVDERGQAFKVRIVGAVANSILQGQLIIDEAEFVKRFPGESGYRMFLINAPSNAVSQVSATLSRAMQDVGLELTPAPQRLAQFNAVQNTYLGTFQVLGGLGLLLGSVGLGIVVLRNVLERRGELALLMAVGFRKPQVQRLLLLENGALLAAGLALGVVAAAVAVLPAVLSPNAELPYGSLAVTLIAVLLNGGLWTWAATRLAVRGDLLGALRNE